MSGFFTEHIVRTLGGQSQKVFAIFDMSLGWEVWAQIELALDMKHSRDHGGRAELEFGRFEREKMVYEGTVQRCDFLLEMSLAHVRHLHFVELKCLSKGEAISAFAARVGKDFDKVKTAEPRKEWVGQARAVTGWVIAITVDPARDGRVDDGLNQLAVAKGIQWNYANVTRDGILKVWTWKKTFYEGGRRV